MVRRLSYGAPQSVPTLGEPPVNPLEAVKALTFDLFGTILDLAGSLERPIAEWLREHAADDAGEIAPTEFWSVWRARQRIEQYQDTIVMMGHSGYRAVARRALVWTAARFGLHPDASAIDALMQAWWQLRPFDDVRPALERLKPHYRLVVLSNGEPDFLDHLASRQVEWPFDAVISVNEVGAFKPHPAVYRHAAARLGLEVGQCLMVSANSFDVMGARMCGFRGIYVNRYRWPFEDTTARPDAVVGDFTELADTLLDRSEGT